MGSFSASPLCLVGGRLQIPGCQQDGKVTEVDCWVEDAGCQVAGAKVASCKVAGWRVAGCKERRKQQEKDEETQGTKERN